MPVYIAIGITTNARLKESTWPNVFFKKQRLFHVENLLHVPESSPISRLHGRAL